MFPHEFYILLYEYEILLIILKTGSHLTACGFSIDSMAAKLKQYEKQRYEAMKQLLPPLRQQQPAAGLQHHAANLQQQLPAAVMPPPQQPSVCLQQPMGMQPLQPVCVIQTGSGPKWPSHNQPVRHFVKFADKAGEFLVR